MKALYGWIAANKFLAGFITVVILGLIIWFFVWLANKDDDNTTDQPNPNPPPRPNPNPTPEPNPNPSQRIAELFSAPRMVNPVNTTQSSARVNQGGGSVSR